MKKKYVHNSLYYYLEERLEKILSYICFDEKYKKIVQITHEKNNQRSPPPVKLTMAHEKHP